MGELLGAYVLGACGEEEAVLVRRHVAVCPACSEVVEALAPARDGLLRDVEEAPVPGPLRSRVMAQVRADAALFDAARERPAARPAPRRSLLRRLLAPRPAWALGLAAVAAVALTLTLDGVLLGGAERETVYTARVDGVMAPGGRASVSVHDGEVRLRVAGLPHAGEGRLYEVWMVRGPGPPEPAGVRFSVDAEGRAEAAMRGVLRPGQQVMVTSEVGGRAAVPTRAPILRVVI
jgi:hypothetical protein